MRILSTALLLIGIASPGACQTTNHDALIGAWAGESICTKLRPACHDEHALYRIASTPNDESTLQMSMAKVVDGQEIVMGVLPFHVDDKRRVLSSEFSSGELHHLWTFEWSGSHMTGTLATLPKKEIVRNIDLRKQ